MACALTGVRQSRTPKEFASQTPLTTHFGYWFRPPRARKLHWRVDSRSLYAQLVKLNHCRKLAHTITRMLCGQYWQLNIIPKAHSSSPTIQTAFIERVNLSIRQGVAALTPRTWSLAQSPQHRLLHVEWWRCYYHFARPHQSLQLKLPGLKHCYRSRHYPSLLFGAPGTELGALGLPTLDDFGQEGIGAGSV